MNLEFVESLPKEPTEAWERIFGKFLDSVKNYRNWEGQLEEGKDTDDIDATRTIYYSDFLNLFAIIETFIGINYPNILSDSDYPDNSGSIYERIESIIDCILVIVQPKLMAIAYKDAMERKYSKEPQYQFLGEDAERIQFLINDLRNLLARSTSLDSKHQERLLKRLEALQKELHKETADLDRFWGFLMDTSATLKVVGENTKPMVDRVQEIANIIWRIQARAHGLPEDSPSLPPVGSSLELPEANDD